VGITKNHIVRELLIVAEKEIFIYLQSYKYLMKVKYLVAFAALILLFLNFSGIYLNISWIAHTAYISFFIGTVFYFIRKLGVDNGFYYLFIFSTLLSFIFRLFQGQWFCDEISLVLLSLGYCALIVEAAKYLEIKNASISMQLFFIFLIGINTLLIFTHVYELKGYISSSLKFYLYFLYYINLLVLGVVAFLYYLNSYSKKSMYFISLALTLMFADVLRDMDVFYLKDFSVEIAENSLRFASAFFVVKFFTTEEKPLKLLNFI